METKMAFYRNMPIRLFKTILVLFSVYLIILIPEFWALKGVAMEHHAFMDYLVIVATAPCMLLLMHAMLYTEDYQMEDYLKMLFGIWTVYFFFGLSNFRWLLPIVSLIAAFIIFYTTYYRYEKNMEVEGIEWRAERQRLNAWSWTRVPKNEIEPKKSSLHRTLNFLTSDFQLPNHSLHPQPLTFFFM